MTADEQRAVDVLKKIAELATSLYPWADYSVLAPELPYALGQISWLARSAIARVHDRDAGRERK
jgi:hypothetical protein